MADNTIRLHVSSDYDPKGTDKAEKAVEKLGKVSQKSSKEMTEGHGDVMKGLGRLGSRFRYLSLVVGATSGAMMLATKSFVDSYKEYERGMLGLNVMAKTTGQSMTDATALATKYARTGLMSISEAATSVQNLLAAGLNLEQVDKLMQGALDTSVFLHEEMYTIGSAVEKMTFGFRVLNERNIDAIGINQRLNRTYKEYESTIGKTTEQFTELDRHMAVYNKLIQETSRYTGGADFAMNTFSGTLDRLSANIEIFKVRMGEALVPVIGTLAEKMTDLVIKFTNFISANKKAAAALQIGIVMLSTFAAALAMVGAMIPMLTVGLVALKAKAIAALLVTGIALTAKILALVVALGALTVIILKVTGKWDEWSDSLERNIDLISRVFKEIPSAAAKASAEALESYAEFTKQLAKENRDYEESLMELARKHSQTIDKLEADLAKLQKDETKYLDRRKRDYDEAMADMDESHKDRIFELERDLKEELSAGIRADQEKIRDLKERIAKENKEYEKDKKRKKRDYKEDVADYEESTKERKSAIEIQLEKEYDLREKYKDTYEQWRKFAFLDEFEKMKRTHKERVEQIDEQIDKLGLTEDQIKSIGDKQTDVNVILEDTSDALHEITDDIINMGNEIDNNTSRVYAQGTAWENLGMMAGHAADEAARWWSETILNPEVARKKYPPTTQTLQKLGQQWLEGLGVASDVAYSIWSQLQKGWKSYQFGGTVPGFPTQRVPAILHGGERVIPSNQIGQLAPITIHINNPIVRRDEDIRKMTNSIEKVLARRVQLQRLGAK